MTVYISYPGSECYHQTEKELLAFCLDKEVKSFKELSTPNDARQFTWAINPVKGGQFFVIIGKDGTPIQNLFEKERVLNIIRSAKKCHTDKIILRTA